MEPITSTQYDESSEDVGGAILIIITMFGLWGLAELYSYYCEYKTHKVLLNDYFTLTHDYALNNKRMDDLEEHMLTLRTLNTELKRENSNLKEQVNKLNSIKLDELIEKMVILDKIT